MWSEPSIQLIDHLQVYLTFKVLWSMYLVSRPFKCFFLLLFFKPTYLSCLPFFLVLMYLYMYGTMQTLIPTNFKSLFQRRRVCDYLFIHPHFHKIRYHVTRYLYLFFPFSIWEEPLLFVPSCYIYLQTKTSPVNQNKFFLILVLVGEQQKASFFFFFSFLNFSLFLFLDALMD